MSIIKKSLIAATVAVAVAGNAYSADLTNYNTQQSFDYGNQPAFSGAGPMSVCMVASLPRNSTHWPAAAA